MIRPPLSVTVIAFNEEKNIERALRSVQWAEEILVVDSGSTDQTVAIAKSFGATVIHHPWPGYGQQKNFAQQHATHDWVLNIDADEEVPHSLAIELQRTLEQVQQGELKASGFYFPRKTYFLGHWIRHGGWYPNHLVRLANRKSASWSEPHVHEQLKIKGSILPLHSPLHHYAFTSIQEQILTNLKFAQLGAHDLRSKGKTASRLKLVLKPLGKFIETYFIKRGFLDGLPGFIISVNAAYSIFLKYSFFMEDLLKKNENLNH